MATGLAIIHWYAGVDGMNIEFVLGGVDGWDNEQTKSTETHEDTVPFSSTSIADIATAIHLPTPPTPPASNTPYTQLYVLDFDKASLLPFDRPDTAIQRLVTAVTCNDPYFPDPTTTQKADREVWTVFRDAYLQTANYVVERLAQKHGKAAKKWPTRFLDQWERKAEELAVGRDGSFVEFGY